MDSVVRQLRHGIRLKDYIEMKMREGARQQTLDEYVYGRACDSCLLVRRGL